jgi:site-specific DNA recombinase
MVSTNHFYTENCEDGLRRGGVNGRFEARRYPGDTSSAWNDSDPRRGQVNFRIYVQLGKDYFNSISGKMKMADLYVRVSTDEQADKGYSQRNQEEVLKKYCSINRFTVRKIIFEDHSAKTFNRPQWAGLLADLKKHKGRTDLVLFTKWDRFSRNAGDAYQMINTLRKLGVEPQAIEQPLDLSVPENKMMLAFYLAAPEVENDRRALNVLHGMRRARKEGRWMGPAPFGYENKITETGRKYIAPYEPEAAVIRWVFNELAAGRQSVFSVWEEARLKGLKCSKNTLWLIIRNPVYCGKILVSKYKDEETQYVKGQHEGIISESLFYEVQDILDGKRKIYKTKKESQELQLRGFLICPKCGKILTGSASKGRKERYFYYHCVSPCNTRFKVQNANKLFLKVLMKFTPRPGMKEAYRAVLEKAYQSITAGEREDLKLLKSDLDQIQNKIAKARELLLAGDLDAADYKTIKQEGEEKINVLEARLFNTPAPERNPSDILDKALKVLCQLDQLYEEGDLKRKRNIIGSIFPEKLTFNGFYYRTTRINEAVRLIYSLDADLTEKENGQPEENFKLSIPVARPGFEPRQTEPKSVVLPLYYRAIRAFYGMGP